MNHGCKEAWQTILIKQDSGDTRSCRVGVLSWFTECGKHILIHEVKRPHRKKTGLQTAISETAGRRRIGSVGAGKARCAMMSRKWR